MRRETDTNYVHVRLTGGWAFTERIYLDYKVDGNGDRILKMDHLLKEKARIEAESVKGSINWNEFMERNSDEIPGFTYWRKINLKKMQEPRNSINYKIKQRPCSK
jgi:hypothetical protein